jgi:uncharacterized protein YdeI (YjbR/CyaY-like superfamily)
VKYHIVVDQTYEQYYAPDRAAWRAWLQEHHLTAPGVWLIYYKKRSGKPRVVYADAVEEALCFGWIDSRPNTLDAERYAQLFTPRQVKSPWSRLNKERVERLIAQGLMAPAGLAAIEAAKQAGTWDSYDEIEDLRIPPDLQEAFAQNVEAQRHFTSFSPTTQKQLLWWLASAKRPETRARRLGQLVAAAAENSNPLAYRRKPERIQATQIMGSDLEKGTAI